MKKTMLGVMLLAAVLLVCATSHGAEYQGLVDQFFTLVAQGKSAEGLDLLYATNEGFAQDEKGVKEMKDKLAAYEKAVGKYNKHTLMIDEDIKAVFACQIYLVAYDQSPAAFTFSFYKPKDKWMLNGISFDGNLAGRLVSGVAQRLEQEIFPHEQ